MKKTQAKTARRSARRNRIRARVIGTATKPRLAVFKSNVALYVQLINDETGTTIAAADSRKLKGATTAERATALGTEIAKLASTAGIKAVVFDRGGYRYQGNIAALADAARAGGLEF
ncbi:50S ribosomal protein L18 [Candidatus Kaiserbacteria bacterium]|nr:50S ribosomal protein L18 [Candidatus Kaiserbacteria bacterium]MCB9811397.1 50S ribosomal protein L18 [Candidatus Nomurabacteria bacterium]